MMIVLLVGIASGIASAALSLALASGSMLSVLLFIFAPLPIFIASLGWQHQAGLIGVMIAASILFGLGDFDTARAYASRSARRPGGLLISLCSAARATRAIRRPAWIGIRSAG